MNNNIQESYCSFEISKLLKEKKFNIQGINCKYYSKDGKKVNFFNIINNIDVVCSPTHALAIEWIRVNFDLVVSYYPYYLKWASTIDKIDKSENYNYLGVWNSRQTYPVNFDSPQQAIKVALLYTLQNLIK